MSGRKMFNEGPLMDLWIDVQSIRENPGACHDKVLKRLVQGVKLDDYVYRIMSVERFEEMVRCRRLTLTAPECWDDPYEAALLFGRGIRERGNDLAQRYADAVHAQCWSLQENCDGMWRGFAHNSAARPDVHGIRERNDSNSYVQIASSVRNLLLSIICGNADIHGFLMCGAIEYLPRRTIDGRLRTLEVTGFYDHVDARKESPFDVAEAFFIKRDAFAYEKEVRLVVISGMMGEDGFDPYPLYENNRRIAIPFNEVCIERIVLDPWASNDESYWREALKELQNICPRAGVVRSDLYHRF